MRYIFITAGFLIALICCRSFTCAESNRTAGIAGQAGPTLLLEYQHGGKTNSVDAFMYFVPLIAPSLVASSTSEQNLQKASITSWYGRFEKDSFYINCGLTIKGPGWYLADLDPNDMIAENIRYFKPPEPLKYMLRFIRLTGDCSGIVEIKGTIQNSVRIVDYVKVCFNAGGAKSPVTIGTYDVKYVNNRYKYKNRFNDTIVRVNSLAFRRIKGIDQLARMAVQVASITSADGDEGLWSGVKGFVANLFIPPMPITAFGNETMLDFGLALAEKRPSFTFPALSKTHPKYQSDKE